MARIITDIVMAVLFGGLGITALIGAIFYGAGHQFAVAMLCGLLTAVAIADCKDAKSQTGEDYERME